MLASRVDKDVSLLLFFGSSSFVLVSSLSRLPFYLQIPEYIPCTPYSESSSNCAASRNPCTYALRIPGSVFQSSCHPLPEASPPAIVSCPAIRKSKNDP